jgi:3-oxoacyl-[acyl-carrier-protein] synthase III
MYVAATGINLPARVPLAPEIAAGRYDAKEAARTQMVEFARDTEGLSSVEYAARAGRDALDTTADHILQDLTAVFHLSVSPFGGPPAYNAASKLHHLLDLGPTVDPFGLTNGCTISLAAIEEACYRLNGHPQEKSGAVLIAASEVWPEALANPLTASRGLILADGAAAITISTTPGFASILATGSRIDSRMSDATRGAETLAYDPSAKIDLGARFDHYAAHEFDAPTHRKMRDDLVRPLVAEVLKDAGLGLDQIDAYVLTHSGARNLASGYFRLLPDAEHKTNTKQIGLHVGHVGSADWLIGFHLLRAQGSLKRGDHVLMLGGGGGWQESAVVLRVL